MQDLINQLEQLVDSGSVRVRAKFAELRDAVPRPKTLVFVPYGPFAMQCKSPLGNYEYWPDGDNWKGNLCGSVVFTRTEKGMRELMQSHFNSAWSAMTEGNP